MELTIGTERYRVDKMDAIKQFHLSRKIGGVLFALGGVAASLRNLPKTEDGKLDVTEDKAISAMGPVAQALGSMSEEDSNYVLSLCLGAVSRAQGSGWARVLAPGPQLKLMFNDIDLGVMMQLALAVIQENLGNFFPGLPEST